MCIVGIIQKKYLSNGQSLSDKPMYLSEAGSDSYMTVANHEFSKGENQKAQAQSLNNILDDVFEYKID